MDSIKVRQVESVRCCVGGISDCIIDFVLGIVDEVVEEAAVAISGVENVSLTNARNV